MNAVERFETAVAGGKPDRVPTLPKIWVDLAAALEGVSLREVIGSPDLAVQVVVDAAQSVRADAARLFNLPGRLTREVDGRLEEIDGDGKRIGVIDFQGGLATRLDEPASFRLDDPAQVAHLQFYQTECPFAACLDDVKRIAVPQKALYEEMGWGNRQREALRRAGDSIALIGDCGSATMAFHIQLRYMESALLDLILDPGLVHASMEKGANIAIERGKFHIDCGLSVLRLNDSAGNMTVISPKHWREFVFPHMRDVCAELHGYAPGVLIYCHICGNVAPILDDLAATGLDCIGPLDPLGGASCTEVREVVQDRAALMGGVDTLTFVNGTPEALIEEARCCIEGAGVNGGFILGSGCALPRSAKREILLALAEAAERYGRYAPDGPASFEN